MTNTREARFKWLCAEIKNARCDYHKLIAELHELIEDEARENYEDEKV